MRNYYEIRSRDVKTEITIGRFTKEILHNDILEIDFAGIHPTYTKSVILLRIYIPVCDVRIYIYIRNIIYLSF